jgi:hypothetical protein
MIYFTLRSSRLMPAALLLGLVLAAMLPSACGVGLVVGSGNTTTEARAISGVDGVALGFIGDLYITQGEEERLVITGDDNVLPLITTEVRDGIVTIGSKSTLGIPAVTTLRYDLMVRDLSSLRLSGAGSAQMDSLQTEDLVVTISGAGNLAIQNLTARRIVAKLSGLGSLTLSGQATSLNVTLSGAGSYNGGKLATGAADVALTGLGSASVWATESLNAAISGAGNIDYYGDPEVTSQITGLGSINNQGVKE